MPNSVVRRRVREDPEQSERRQRRREHAKNRRQGGDEPLLTQVALGKWLSTLDHFRNCRRLHETIPLPLEADEE